MATTIFTTERQMIEHLVQVQIKSQHFFLRNYSFDSTEDQMKAVIGQALICDVIPFSSRKPNAYQVLSSLNQEIGSKFLEINNWHQILVLEGNPGDAYKNIVVHIEKY